MNRTTKIGIPRKNTAAYQKAWRKLNPEKTKELNKRGWLNRDKEKTKKTQREYYHSVVKKSEKYKKDGAKRAANLAKWKLKKQEEKAGYPRPNRCEICEENRKIVFDHNHLTNSFRGWICDKCNVAIGMVDENIDRLNKIIVYLDKRGTAKKTKVTLALCTNREIKAKTLQSLLEMVAYSKEIDFHILVANRGYTVGENRNYCVVQATKQGSDYLLFVDDDMVFPEYTLESLLEHKVDVVGVNSYSRCLPLSSTVGLMDKNGGYMHPDKHTAWEMRIPPTLFEAYFVGAGVMLIDMKVFDKLEKPYFLFTTDDNGMIVNGEDGYFCDQVRKAGMKVWCDPELEIGHIGEYEYKKLANEPLIQEL